MTQREQPRPEGMWNAHPVLSMLLRAGIFTIPIASALGTTWLVRSQFPPPADGLGLLLWWGLLLALGVVVAMAVERIARRLVPLATLLRLSMLFPDRAPSRFRVARKSGNLKHLESLQTRTDDAGDSATQILTLVTALSNHDRHTRGHAERVRVFTDMLSEELGLPERDRYRLRWAALLHDIGKLTIDPSILNKKSKLDEQEWTLIREHPSEGVRLAGPLVEWLGPWGQAIAHHHERVDGTGYPRGLDSEQISLGGRIVSVADAYDTMTSARSYQKPKATAAARRELVANAGSQFDGTIVRAFLAISLPRLLWATGPLSLAVHLPFLAQLQQIGQTSIAAAAQTATVTAVAGVTAMGLMSSPAMAKVDRPIGRIRTVIVAEASRSTDVDTHGSASQDEAGSSQSDAGAQTGGSPGDSSSTGGSGTTATPATGSSSGTGEGQQGNDSDEGSSSDPGSNDGSGSDEGSGGGSGNSGSGNSGSGSGGSGTGGGSGSGGSGGGSSHAQRSARALNLIARLQGFVTSSGINQHAIDDLTRRLDDAAEEINDGRFDHARDRMEQFISKIHDAVENHHHELDSATADAWVAKAQEIRAALAS